MRNIIQTNPFSHPQTQINGFQFDILSEVDILRKLCLHKNEYCVSLIESLMCNYIFFPGISQLVIYYSFKFLNELS